MSDTPRTDNAERQCQCKHGCHVASSAMEQMERELNQWRECATSLREILVSYPCYAPANQIDSALNRFNELNK